MVSYYGDTKQNKLNKYKWYKKELYEYWPVVNTIPTLNLCSNKRTY